MSYYSCKLYCFQISLAYVLILSEVLNMVTAQDGFASSRATYTGSPDCYTNPTEACGYGDYGRTVNGGIVTGVSRLYRNGSGCGACYQVRCRLPDLCHEYGTSVVVTDYGEGDRTDFILSEEAFKNLANPNMAYKLMSYGVIDVEYKRISCGYPNSNIMIKIHENSYYPDYLALIILYNAGMYDITGVEIWHEDYKYWVCMRRAYGAVWDLANPQRSNLMLRVQVNGANGIKYIQPKTVIPSDWKPGAAYDSEVQLN
uniref:Expansin-like B1 n=1 Tax=Kalanchoe fedtschenkoi TaxID=63787 RepID=A0A7N0VGG8_KALFE